MQGRFNSWQLSPDCMDLHACSQLAPVEATLHSSGHKNFAGRRSLEKLYDITSSNTGVCFVLIYVAGVELNVPNNTATRNSLRMSTTLGVGKNAIECPSQYQWGQNNFIHNVNNGRRWQIWKISSPVMCFHKRS